MNDPILEIHDLCAMFPDMSGDVYAKLVDSVRRHGAMKPVVLHEGKILDGRNRYRAYMEAGVDFETTEWAGEYGTPLEFVLAENEVRRDLTPSQRAALAVEVKKRLNDQYKDRQVAGLKKGDDRPDPRVANNCETGSVPERRADARNEAAEKLGANHQYVSDAERIQESSPQVFAEVKSGEKTIPQAKRELGLDKPKSARGKMAAVVPAPPLNPGAPAPGSPFEEAAQAPTDGASLIEDVREEYEERAAKVDELPDDEWLTMQPLSSVLVGHALKKFQAAALFYRDFERGMRRSLARWLAGAKKERFGRSSQSWLSFRIEQALKIGPPSSWKRCAAPDDGGCGGSGQAPMVGECPECKGRGYIER